MSDDFWLNNHFPGLSPDYLCKALKDEEITTQQCFTELTKDDLEEFIKTYHVKMGHRLVLRKLHSTFNTADTSDQKETASVDSAVDYSTAAAIKTAITLACNEFNSAKDSFWICNRCTLKNESESDYCEVCGAKNPSSKPLLAHCESAPADDFERMRREMASVASPDDILIFPAAGVEAAMTLDEPCNSKELAADEHFAKQLHKTINASVPGYGRVFSPIAKSLDEELAKSLQESVFSSKADDEHAQTLDLMLNLATEPGSWVCATCFLPNLDEKNFCVSCDSRKPSSKQQEESPSATQADKKECGDSVEKKS